LNTKLVGRESKENQSSGSTTKPSANREESVVRAANTSPSPPEPNCRESARRTESTDAPATNLNDIEVEAKNAVERVEETNNVETEPQEPLLGLKEDEVVNLNEKSLLLADMEDIEEESKASDRRWVQMFKRRKERKKHMRDSKSPGKDGVTNTTVVPDTPEKCENDPMSLIDWDNEVLPPSDDETERKPWSQRKRESALHASRSRSKEVSTEEESVAEDTEMKMSPVLNGKKVKTAPRRKKKSPSSNSKSLPKYPTFDSDDDFV